MTVQNVKLCNLVRAWRAAMDRAQLADDDATLGEICHEIRKLERQILDQPAKSIPEFAAKMLVAASAGEDMSGNPNAAEFMAEVRKLALRV